MAGQGQIYSFSDTVTTKRTIGNVIHNIEPMDIPLISYFGTKNESKFGMINWPNHKYSWLEDTNRIRTATLNEAMDTTETGMDVASGHGLRFKSGDVWQSDETDELVWVDTISTDTVTVVRNYGAFQGGAQGTATSSITTLTALTYRYSARLEGDDSDPSYWVTPSEAYNYSQIFHAELKISGSEQNASSRYGISNQREYQIKKLIGGGGAGDGKRGRAGDLMRDLENTFYTGVKKERSSTVAGSMGGFRTMVTTNVVDLNGASLTQAKLEEALALCWAAGGTPDVIITGLHNKRLISSWFAGQTQQESSDRTGGVVIDHIRTEMGTFDIMLARRNTADEVFIAERDKVGWVTLRPWFVHPLAVNGDYVKEEVLGEYGFVVVNEAAHAIIKETAIS